MDSKSLFISFKFATKVHFFLKIYFKLHYFYSVKKTIIYTFFTFLLGACTLNATQEQSLNQAVSLYVNAWNKGNTLKYVAMTHPCVVANYQKNDSLFTRRFSPLPASHVYHNPMIQTIQKSDKGYRVKFQVNLKMPEEKSKTIYFYAESEDGLSNWSFYEESDIDLKNNCLKN